MKIVYVTDSKVNPTAGGISRITYVMAEALRTSFGYEVYFYRGQEDFIEFIRKIGTCTIIVQSPCKLSRTVFKNVFALPGAKIVNVFHGTPGYELVPLKCAIIKYRILHNIDRKWTIKQFLIQVGMHILPQKCFTQLLTKKYSLPYGNVDKMVVLSQGIIDQYQSIAPGYKNLFVAIPNALSFDKPKLHVKENEVLVVARLDDWHKRISEILEIWKEVQQDKRFCDWTLRIVGDGIDKPYYEEYIRGHNVKNIVFDGQQNPLSYYQKASVFLMTSACEGFPMTLLEAQQCGCVPILYDSFASAKDVVTDGENGILIEDRDKEAYVAALKKLMKDDALRNRMSEACIKSSERFSVENIAAQWNELFESLRP